jgi:single-strand DNA-binding protein
MERVMANDLNLWLGIGHLGKDPEVRFKTDGKPVATFSLAVNWKGATTEGVTWVPIVAYDRLAEICGEYLKKGAKVQITGKYNVNKWTSKEGEKRERAEIVATQMQMLGPGRQSDEPPRQQFTRERSRKPQPVYVDDNLEDDNEIPF